jgi:diguanylate cyclase
MSNGKRTSRRKGIGSDAVLDKTEKVLARAISPDTDMTVEYRELVESYRKLHHKLHKTLFISDSYQQQSRELAIKLDQSTLKLRQLSEVALPICTCCHKIRTNDDYWERLESFFIKHTDILFSHGICPECIKTTYGKLGEQIAARSTPTPSSPSSTLKPKASPQPPQDEIVREMRDILERVKADDDPLIPDIERIVGKYEKLRRRFDKIVSISDSYQSQLRDFNLRLELMARTDLLTGLANRWEMVQRLEMEKSRSERHNKKFSLILADIDTFKEINDTYGHLAGDRVLKEIASRIKNICRAEDLCVRWGGDEFLVLVVETDLKRAMIVAEKISRAVRETPVSGEQRRIPITLSVGVGEFVRGNSIDEFINRVDAALYSAKRAGRDRVMVE